MKLFAEKIAEILQSIGSGRTRVTETKQQKRQCKYWNSYESEQ